MDSETLKKGNELASKILKMKNLKSDLQNEKYSGIDKDRLFLAVPDIVDQVDKAISETEKEFEAL